MSKHSRVASGASSEGASGAASGTSGGAASGAAVSGGAAEERASKRTRVSGTFGASGASGTSGASVASAGALKAAAARAHYAWVHHVLHFGSTDEVVDACVSFFRDWDSFENSFAEDDYEDWQFEEAIRETHEVQPRGFRWASAWDADAAFPVVDAAWDGEIVEDGEKVDVAEWVSARGKLVLLINGERGTWHDCRDRV